MSQPIDLKNIWELFTQLAPFFTLLLAIFSYMLYRINKRTFNLLCGKPKIEITKVSTKKPEINKWEERIENCFIEVNIFNPSSFGNHVSIKIKNFLFTKTIKSFSLIYGPKSESGNFFELPPFKKISLKIIPEHKEIEKYIGKKMRLIIIDIREKKTIKKFTFSDLNL